MGRTTASTGAITVATTVVQHSGCVRVGLGYANVCNGQCLATTKALPWQVSRPALPSPPLNFRTTHLFMSVRIITLCFGWQIVLRYCLNCFERSRPWYKNCAPSKTCSPHCPIVVQMSNSPPTRGLVLQANLARCTARLLCKCRAAF